LQASANLEIEVTNLASKAGKGNFWNHNYFTVKLSLFARAIPYMPVYVSSQFLTDMWKIPTFSVL
jgi:hypothetical protein